MRLPQSPATGIAPGALPGRGLMRIVKTANPPAFEEIHPPELRPAMQSVWREGYRQGWRDRGRLGAKRAGSATSEAKKAAAKANGAKGGRPRRPRPTPA